MAAARIGVDNSSARQSLKWRLPALICGLLVVVLVGVVYTAYSEVDTTLKRGAGERAHHAASQVAGMFAPVTAQTVAHLQQIAPQLQPVVEQPTAESRRAARALIAGLAPTPQRRVSIWSASGARLLDVPEQTAVSASPQPPRAGISPIQTEGDQAFVDVAVALPGAAGGTLSVRSVLSVSPPDALTRLIGGDARILFGNHDGRVWTDMTHIVPGPDIDRTVTSFQRYRTALGDERLGAFSSLPGTPWLVWVEFPETAITATTYAFLRRMVITVFFVAIGAVFLVRRLVVAVTSPLAAMTTAAEAMAAGDYSRRVNADRADEIGRLGRAFNAMSGDVARELAERTRAHDLLQEREAQLRLYAVHSPVAVAMFDRDMRYLVASDRWIEDYQLGSQKLVGRSHYEVFPDLPQRWLDIHQRCLAGAVEKCDEDPFPRAGVTAWLRWEIRPWRQADGAVGGLIIFAEDITARKQSDAALRASESSYRTLFNHAPDGIAIADSDGRYLDANVSMCRMLGYARDEFVGLHVSDVVAPSEAAYIAPAFAEVDARADHHREWRFRRQDGSLFDADVTATRMPDGTVLGLVRDTTERNQAIEALRIAEERMRFALEAADVGIWDADYRAGTVRWSAILETQYGLAPGTFAGTFEAFLSCIHPDDRDGALATIDEATRTGTDFALRHRIVRPDGGVRWIEGAGNVQLGSSGEPVRAVGISRDVTAGHNLEAQFQQAQKMEAIGRLAGGVAHDFNNLLTAILGYCELLLDDLDADSAGRLEITEIQNAGIRAAGLTKQLLAFSRKQIVEPKLLDLNSVVSGVQPLLQRLIDESVDIVMAIDDRPLPVTADLGQIEQVIVNLAVNARDAMPRGGTLTIGTASVELDAEYAAAHFDVKPGHYVSLTISDTGTGMSPEIQAHLFEPFFTTKEQGKGTGLGLATVHGVVTGCGGSVGVYSEVDRGTSFVVYLPQAAAIAAPVAAPDVPASTRVRGRTVLVVEDADGLRELMRQILERQGHTVLLASNAIEAQQRFEANAAIELLLTDVIMPGASGPELTVSLLRRRSSLKVIYMSGYTEDTIVRHGVLEPGINFIHKPFTARALGEKIRDVFEASA